MRILLKNIGTSEFMVSQKTVVGAPAPWSICMFIHALLGEASKKLPNPLTLTDYSYVLHKYNCEDGMVQEPFDSNRICSPYSKVTASDFGGKGMKDTRRAEVRVSIILTIDEGNVNSERALRSIKENFFNVRLCGGCYDEYTLMRNIDDTVLTIENESHILKELKRLGGFICRSLYTQEEMSQLSGDELVDTLLSATAVVNVTDKNRKEKKNSVNPDDTPVFTFTGQVRAVLAGFASISGKPTDRDGSRNGNEHIFAEPIFELIEWVRVRLIDEFSPRDRWGYHVNDDRTIFMTKTTA